MLKNAFTPFGVLVRAKLSEIGETQEWLCTECRKKTGLYVDSAVMNRFLTGRRNSPRLEEAIRETLNLRESPDSNHRNTA